MKTRKELTVMLAVVVCVSVLGLWNASGIAAKDRIVEIHPDVSIGSYPGQAPHVIGAYERLMDRYMAMVQGNMKTMATDVDSVEKKLDSIETKVDELGKQLSRIEKALNIEPPAGSERPASDKKNEIFRQFENKP